VWHTFLVDGNGDGSCPSLGFCVVDGGGSLRPQRGLASVQLGHLGVEGCLLTNELIIALTYPSLSVDLPGTGSRLLLLLVGLLLIGAELNFWLGCRCPHRDRQDGLESQSVLRNWCVEEGVY
jgi:hypothetical protein